MSIRGIRHSAEAYVFGLLQRAACALPLRTVRGIGSALGAIAFRLDRRHRRITLDNLRLALGTDRSADERDAIAARCWRHFGSVLFEALTLSRIESDRLDERVRIEGFEHMRRAHASGRGVIAFTGHFGNWELAAVAQGHLGLPLALLARPLDNPELERMLARLREASGNRIVHKRNAVRELMRVLRSGGAVAFMIDQDARADGVFVPFFGHAASTSPTLALLALRTGAAIIPVRTRPGQDGVYEVTCYPPLAVQRTSDRAADLLRITADCTGLLEQWVREDPAYWMWMHRRWKTRPPGERS